MCEGGFISVDLDDLIPSFCPYLMKVHQTLELGYFSTSNFIPNKPLLASFSAYGSLETLLMFDAPKRCQREFVSYRNTSWTWGNAIVGSVVSQILLKNIFKTFEKHIFVRFKFVFIKRKKRFTAKKKKAIRVWINKLEVNTANYFHSKISVIIM